jgi:hypothetical protein
MSNSDFDEFEDTPTRPARKAPARKAPAKKAAAKRPARKAASKIPPNAPQPQDRQEKAIKAREAEANGTEIETVEIFGETFDLNTDAFKYSFDLHEGFSDNNAIKIVRGALGVHGWEKLKAIAIRDRITVEDAITGASEVIATTMGFESAGN